MNFQEMLKQQLDGVNQGGFEDDNNRPDKLLKYPKLYFDKNTTTMLLRILPPVSPDKNFAEGFRSIFLEAVSDTGKEVKASMQLSLAPDINSPLENALNTWGSQGLLPNKFNPQQQQKPASRFLVNAVQVQINPQDGSFHYETDPATGNLMVRVVELPQSAFSEIGTKLQDMSFAPPQPQGTPSEITQYSFISETNAYALKIVKPARGSGKMSYDVDVMQSVQLQALPQGWQALCEDLALQAQPTEVHSGEFVGKFIGWFNNKANGMGGFGQQQQFQQQPNFQQQQQPNFQQQQPNFQQQHQAQPNFQQQQFQQPANTQQQFGQGQQQFQGNQVNQQQQFQQPAEQQQFNGQASTQTYVDQNQVADVAPTSQFQNNQVGQQNQQQFAQNTQGAPTQDASGEVPQQPDAIPNVNDLLNQMQGLS